MFPCIFFAFKRMRAGMDVLPSRSCFSAAEKFKVAIIAEVIQYSCGRLNFADILSFIGNHFLAHSCEDISMKAVCEWCLLQTQSSCLVINVDEAQWGETGGALTQILMDLGKALCQGVPVYFSVTGIFSTAVPEMLRRSFMFPVAIFLPPLSMTDTLFICHSIGLIGPDGITCEWLRLLVWQAGGVPRNIAKAVYSIAHHLMGRREDTKTYRLRDLNQFQGAVKSLSQNDFTSIQRYWKCTCAPRMEGRVGLRVMSDIVSLCVSECVVDNDVKLGGVLTVEEAQADWLFLDSSRKVHVPPVLLAYYENGSGSDRAVVLNCMTGILFPSNNEALYVSVICHRMRAQHLLGTPYVQLSWLLGVRLSDTQNCSIAVTDKLGVTRAAKTVDSRVTISSTTAVVNTPTASFADAILTYVLISFGICVLTSGFRLENVDGSQCIIYIHEKQNTMARARYLQESKVSKTLHLSNVADERNKVRNRNLFVYFTDCTWAKGENPTRLEEDEVIITNEMRDQAFGELVGTLKAHCMSPTQIEDSGSNVSSTGKRKAYNA